MCLSVRMLNAINHQVVPCTVGQLRLSIRVSQASVMQPVQQESFEAKQV